MVPQSQWPTSGPNKVSLISRSISQGWRAGLASLVGVIAAFRLRKTATVRMALEPRRFA